MDKKRITLVVSSLACGGVERITAMMANYWEARSHTVAVLTFDDGKNPPFYQLSPGIQHMRIPDPPAASFIAKCRRLVRRIKFLRGAIHHTKPDVVIAHGEFINILCGAACAGFKMPLILTEHNAPQNGAISLGMRLTRDIAYSTARSVVVLTEEASRYFSRWARGKITVIPNTVTPLPEGVAIPPQIEREKVIVGMGRLDPQKGFDYLIRAFAGIESRDWRLVIWGDGPSRAALENLIGALELDERVSLPGITKDPYAELTKGSIFALSSRFEGFPMVLCEAMAAGCAVVSFDCKTGPAEILTPERNGLLIKTEDVEALRAGLARLIAEPELRQSLAAAAQEDVKKFSQPQVMAKWEALISAAISSGAGSG